jgi:hypothetical protein
MFQKTPDDRLSDWSQLRKDLDSEPDPLNLVSKFWASAPLIVHNHKIDPYNFKSWPTPWEIIVDNKYDDFTLALMIGYTLKLSNRFKDSAIQVKTMVDYSKTKLYNLVVINDKDVLNYSRDSAIEADQLDEELYLENIVDVIFPR